MLAKSKFKNLHRGVLAASIAASFWSAAAQAATVNWTTGTTADASGTWDGAASSFNGLIYAATDDLIIDGTAAKTITTTGAITTPLSLSVNSTGATTLTGTSVGGTLNKSAAGALTISTANSFGNVAINGGKFVLNDAGGLGTTGTLNINAGAVSGVAGSYTSPGTNFVYDSSGLNTDYIFSKNITFGTVGAATTYGMAMRGGVLRTTTLSGNITGASNVTMWLDTSTASDGSSMWSLTGDNSGFAGQIRLNRGRLILGNANAGGTGSIFVQTNGNVAGNLVFNFAGNFSTNIIIGTTASQYISTGPNNINYTGVIGGASTAGSWIKTGTGALTISATQNGLSGSGIAAGTLNLDYATNDTTKLSDTASLILSGGTINLLGGTHAETVGSTTLSAGTTAIARTGAATLVMNAITRNAGSALELATGGIATTSTGSASSLLTTGLGVVGVVGGNDWIARDAGTSLVGFSTVGSYTPTTSTTITGNADAAAGVTATTLATGGSATTIRFNQAQATTITNTTGTLSLTQGGILVTPAVGANTTAITGGTLAAGSNNSLLIFQNNTLGGLAISSIVADRSQVGNASYVSGALVKSGAGLLTLSGINTYSGQTYLNGGTTAIAADSGLGGANGIFANLTSLTTSASVTYTGGTLPTGLGIGTALLGSTITAINDSTKTITLAGNANTALTAGTASWANAQTLNLNGGTLQTTATLSMTETNAGGTAGTTTVNRAVVLGGNGGSFNVASGTTLTIPGVVSGAGGLTKSGAGVLTLSVANTYSDGTTISAGTLAVNNNTSLGSGAVLANASFGAGYVSGGSPFLRTSASGLTVSNNIVLSSAAGYYGLQMGGAAGGTVVWSGVISGGGAGTVLQIDTPNLGDGTSVATLSGNNTIAGQIRVNRGRLILANANALGTASLFLQTPGNATNGNLSFSGVTSLSNNLIIGATTNQWINTGAATVNLSGIISSEASGVGGLSKMGTGTLVLTGANTYNGSTTTIADGTLSIAGTGRLNATAFTSPLILTATTSILDYASSTNQTISGVISGAGQITKSGTSTLTLTATNTYTGTTTVNSGSLIVSGSLVNNGVASVLMAAPDDTLAGNPILTRAIVGGTNKYTGYGSTVTATSLDPVLVSSSLQTRAEILTSGATSAGNLGMQWRTRTTAEAAGSNPNAVLSDVLNLTTAAANDIFVLSMSYNDASLSALNLNENSIALSGELRLGWFNGTSWVTAVNGNDYSGGGASAFVGVTDWNSYYNGIAGPHDGSDLASFLGRYGVDPNTNTVWAVVNHNSEFAVIPEPSLFVAGGLALLGLAGLRLRRKRA